MTVFANGSLIVMVTTPTLVPRGEVIVSITPVGAESGPFDQMS